MLNNISYEFLYHSLKLEKIFLTPFTKSYKIQFERCTAIKYCTIKVCYITFFDILICNKN